MDDEPEDEDITEEPDGTFSVRFEVWGEEPLTGIPSRELARRVVRFARDAMRAYARDV